MRIPLTKYGWPQIFIFPAIVLGAMVLFFAFGDSYFGLWAIVSIEVILAIVLVWVLLFFRDPYRRCPMDKDLLFAPADGRITDTEIVDEADFIGGQALRIGIFLSIFDVHINRVPCDVRIEKISYRQGRYKNAMNPESGHVNEANELYMTRMDSPTERLIVRQISGAIARRIVCAVKEEQILSGGEKFGMIKFGSRTELYVPASDNVKCLVEIGDKVRAGITPLVRYER